MESNQTTESAAVVTERPGAPRVPAVLDWFVAAIVALVGLALLVGGTAVLAFVDRSLIARAVADGSIQSTTLSNADLIEVALASATWAGMGLIATGAIVLVGAVAYAVVRRRAHRRAAAGEPTSDYGANAVTGALASVLLAFVPFSPALGGALAGYLERGESERVVGVGALSGLLAMAPLLAVSAFVLGGVAFALLAIEEGLLALVVGAALLLSLMVVATVGAGLGAIGGYVGGKLAEDRVVE